MSTKNLARTAIEVGRSPSWHHETNQARRSIRRSVKHWLKEEGRYDDYRCQGLGSERRVIDEKWSTAWSLQEYQRDKLGPVKQYLESRVGRPFAEVYAEIKERFDERTTAGRHILGHIWQFVNRYGKQFGFGGEIKSDFEIQGGILVRGPRKRPRPGYRLQFTAPTVEKLSAFLKCRKIHSVGEHYYWCEATRPVCVIMNSGLYPKTSHLADYVDYRSINWPPAGWRQTTRLNDKEKAFFLKLGPDLQKQIMR